ncbi:MAG: transposase [Desulfobacteraceae bacterium]
MQYRIVKIEKGKVTIRWKDYRKAMRQKYMELKAEDFISRFLHHILPDGFYKIRYIGFLASVNSRTKKEIVFQLIGQQTYLSVLEGLNAMEVLEIVTKKDVTRCPVCKTGRMTNTGFILRKEKPS